MYKERAQGFIPASRLCELMENAQKTAYNNSLELYHPYFWITKLHFYLSEQPRYNFPYIVGYTLCLALFKKAQENPEWFETHYQTFLQDTSIHPVEGVIKKYFNSRADDPTFWMQAIEGAEEDIHQYSLL